VPTNATITTSTTVKKPVPTMTPASVKKILLILISILATSPVIADNIDFNVGSDAVRFTYAIPIGSSDYGRKDITFGILYNEDDNTFIDAALHIIDEAGSKFPGMEVGIGPKVYFGQTNSEDYLTVGFEALGNYRLAKMNRIVLGAYGYYAPGILSFIDADELWEMHFRASYELIPSASIYLGYRKIRAKVNVKNERTIDDSFHFGLIMEF